MIRRPRFRTPFFFWATLLAETVNSLNAQAIERAFPADDPGPSLREEKAEKNARTQESEEVKKILPTVPRVQFAPGQYKSAVFDTFRSPKVVAGRYFWFSVGFDGSPQVAKDLGFQVSLGYQRDLIGPVLKFRYASIDYGNFTAQPSAADLSATAASVTSSTSEFNRFRRNSDPWSALCADIGIQINGNLMGDWIPHSSQRGAFTVGAGRWSDATNGLGFTSIHFGFEAAFQYHFAARSRFAIELAGTFTAGWMGVGGLWGTNGQATRLPIVWPSAGLNVLFYL